MQPAYSIKVAATPAKPGSLKASPAPAKPAAPARFIPRPGFLAKAAKEPGHPFVRPDLPPVDEPAAPAAAPASPWPRAPASPWPRPAGSNNILEKSPLEARMEERVHFRSALEQVCGVAARVHLRAWLVALGWVGGGVC